MDCVKRNNEVISLEQRSTISKRYKRITLAVNREFWNCTSDSMHSFYVGSYGRGTAVNTSDLDVLIELPRLEYERYDISRGNGQSRLLQAVRLAILETYPRSDVRADGQVVVVDFSDGIRFELLPAFPEINMFGLKTGRYQYPDTNMGGRWRSTNPKAEQDVMKLKNEESNGLLFDTCKHIRQIRDSYFQDYHLSGIVIDSFVYENIGDWHWCSENQESSCPGGTFEKNLYASLDLGCRNILAPGSRDVVDMSSSMTGLSKVLQYMAQD